jgi:hypothetical protein
MKHTLIYLFIAFVFSACCTKKHCTQPYYHLRLSGFTGTELDTIYTTGYAPGSGFTNIVLEKEVDSVGEMYADGTYSIESKTYREFTEDYDWEIYIPAVSRTYRIDGYSYTTFSCNCPQDRQKELSGCKVNGVDQKVNPIVIAK